VPAIELAETLTQGSPFQRAFFCNSGAEAIEGALKLSRKYAKQRNDQCVTVLTMSNSFHGRTFGAMSLTAQTKYHNGYQPLVPGIETVQFNDIDQVLQADLDTVAAIIVEPVQGEGGIHCADANYLKQLRTICNDRDIVLIYDEIQCGIGRSGTFFAFEHFEVEPDIIALAKGLGGGFPIGSFLAKEKIAAAFKPGDHGSTFGGNPLACATALACVRHIKNRDFLNDVRRKSELLRSKLALLQTKHKSIVELRGLGLLVGVEFTSAVKPIIAGCIANGLLVAGAGDNVMRLLPPLTVSDSEISDAVSILDTVLSELPASSPEGV
jgi:acetylornithine/N-succinyldiaminopimelate aminotransferase